ncbi:MAG: hypothetical protein GWN58_37220 [Anaerolineae bacterium]|nr:hypothetical protein [Anaerolineae bacterium]
MSNKLLFSLPRQPGNSHERNGLTGEDLRRFLIERARRRLPHLSIQSCSYSDSTFVLELGTPSGPAKLWLPIREAIAARCHDGDCSELDRTLQQAQSLLDFGSPKQ